MKLKNLETHPKHSNFTTHTGFPLYDYQEDALEIVIDDYEQFLKRWLLHSWDSYQKSMFNIFCLLF